MRSLYKFIIPLFIFISCEKQVDVFPGVAAQKIVVEGILENQKEPYVVLTRTFAYFGKFNADSLANSFVHDAAIYISDGSREVKLKEYERNLFGPKLFYYSTDTTTAALRMPGEFTKNYTLRIALNGEEITAATRIPSLRKKVDSIWWQNAPPPADTGRAVVFTRITDPAGFGDYTRYFTQVNQEPEYAGLNSIFDDQVVDGKIYEIQVFKGENPNAEIDNDNFGFFNRGDKVIVRLSNIDKATFDFWRTWEQNQLNLSNPFGVPVKILSNLKGNAVGYFGGYASSYALINIPR